MSSRNILSLMFALDADQVTRLNHYVNMIELTFT